jgi:hypothetical protein
MSNYLNPFEDGSSKIHFIDPIETKISKYESNYFKAMNGSLRDKFIAAYLHNNHSNPKDSASPVNGTLFFYKEEAPANPKLIKNLFTHKLVANIKTEKLNDQYFIDRQEKINNNIPRFSPNQISLTLLSDNNDTMDADVWEPTLGENGSIRVIKDEGEFGKNYYSIKVKTNAGKVQRELKEFLAEKFKEGMTLGEFINTPQYKKAKDLSERNARRILQLTADVLEVELELSPEDDTHAIVKDERYALPILATPNVHNVSDILLRKIQNGESKILYYHGLTDGSQAIGGLIQESNPISPVRIYNTPIRNSYSSSFSPYTPINNNYMDNLSKNEINQDLADYINERIGWYNKDKNNPYHPKLLGKYKSIDENVHFVNENILGANKGYTDLKPVIAIIKPPNI